MEAFVLNAKWKKIFALKSADSKITKRSGYDNRLGSHASFSIHNALRRVVSLVTWSSCPCSRSAKMGKTKESGDSKRKRKRVAVESSSDDDESEQDLEEVTQNVLYLKG